MKRLATTALLAALAGTAAQADIVRVEAGAGVWNAAPSGQLTDKPSGETFDLKDDMELETKNMSYIWMLVKHPVPVLPNLRLEYTNVDTDGSNFLTQDIVWGPYTYTANTTLASRVNIKQYDATLYYNILDNTFWTTIDFGLDAKMMNIELDAHETAGGTSYNETASITLPMAYLRGRVEVPMTDLGVEADIKYIGFAGSTFYDARVKADYTLSMIPVVQPGLEIGYRVQKFKIDNSNIDVKADIDFAGVYGGLMVRF